MYQKAIPITNKTNYMNSIYEGEDTLISYIRLLSLTNQNNSSSSKKAGTTETGGSKKKGKQNKAQAPS
jgi:hypothetical protein